MQTAQKNDCALGKATTNLALIDNQRIAEKMVRDSIARIKRGESNYRAVSKIKAILPGSIHEHLVEALYQIERRIFSLLARSSNAYISLSLAKKCLDESSEIEKELFHQVKEILDYETENHNEFYEY